MKYIIFFDGACEFNPANGRRNPGGIATYGWLIKDTEGTLVAHGYGEVGRGFGGDGSVRATNNLAEYQALTKALQAARDLGLEVAEIWGDSQLVVQQVSGEWRCNNSVLQKLRDQARELLPADIKPRWHRREFNQEADDLSKKAYVLAKAQGDKGPWEKRFKVGKKERMIA